MANVSLTEEASVVVANLAAAEVYHDNEFQYVNPDPGPLAILSTLSNKQRRLNRGGVFKIP